MVCFASMLALWVALLAAQVSDAPTAPRPLKWNPELDVSATAAMTGFWVLTETALKPTLAPSACEWCRTNSVDLGVRRLLGSHTFANRSNADAASNVTTAAAPLLLLGLDALFVRQSGGDPRDWGTDVVLVAEAAAASMTLNQTVKFLVGRERPFASDLTPAQKAARNDDDANLSFFSGHSTITASIAAAAGTIAWLRGYRHPWIAWVVGGTIAVATGLLRISADKHWFSDVVTGLVIGSSVGVGVPLLLHGRALPVSVSLSPNGVTAIVRF